MPWQLPSKSFPTHHSSIVPPIEVYTVRLQNCTKEKNEGNVQAEFHRTDIQKLFSCSLLEDEKGTRSTARNCWTENKKCFLPACLSPDRSLQVSSSSFLMYFPRDFARLSIQILGCMKHATEVVDRAIMLRLLFRMCSIRIWVRTIDEVPCGFLLSVQANSRTVPQSDYDSLFPILFQCMIHQSSYN